MLGTIRVGSEVRLRARVRNNGTTQTVIASSRDLTLGVWQHAALTADSTWLRLFLDGVEAGSVLTFGAADSDSAVLVAVGAQPPGAGDRHFDGLIDEVRILSRAINAAEIESMA